jgi:hypothetical protein
MTLRTIIVAAVTSVGAVLIPVTEAGAAPKLAPFPTQAQISACVKSVTSHKAMTAKQVATCKAAVWQTYITETCPKDRTNPLDPNHVLPNGYLIQLGNGYRGITGKAAHEWAIRAGHKAFLVANDNVTEEQIEAHICT